MKIYCGCLGVNHQGLSVAEREKIAIVEAEQGQTAQQLIQGENTPLQEAVVLSTCNRSEVYFVTTNQEQAVQYLQQHIFLQQKEQCYYVKWQQQALEHLCQVTVGLNSMVIGETEIFGQVKKAYLQALEYKTTKKTLNQLFQNAFRIGKKSRSQTAIQKGNVSVASIACNLAERVFEDISELSILLIGAGEMAQNTLKYLAAKRPKNLLITNRSHDKAIALSQQFTQAEVVPFTHWQDYLTKVAIVITSTSAKDFIITKQDMINIRATRKYDPLFFIDMTIPRDVDPIIHEFEEVYVYNLDDLNQFAQENKQQRQSEVEKCQQLIATEINLIAHE